VRPTFFVIGAPKCGTSSLHSYLAVHPAIHMSPVKETHFFAGPPSPGRPYLEARVGSLTKYERLFESGALVRGESSPSYSLYPWRSGVPERIHALIPDARFIYLVRDPVDRTVAAYMQSVAFGGERRSLSEALGEGLDAANQYVCGSMYATQVEQYMRSFPADSMLVVDQAALLYARATVMREIFSFLGVTLDFVSPTFAVTLNRSAEHRLFGRTYRLLSRPELDFLRHRIPVPVRRALTAPVKPILTRRLERQEVDDALRARLEDLFRDEVQRLRRFTGQTFASWSL
jgi:Sulfotransferase family